MLFEDLKCIPEKRRIVDPYEDLANAVIELAAEDYRNALKILKYSRKNTKARKSKEELEKFFRSDWYKRLTALEGEYLMSELRKEVENDSN